jgi:hypothetical protein
MHLVTLIHQLMELNTNQERISIISTYQKAKAYEQNMIKLNIPIVSPFAKPFFSPIFRAFPSRELYLQVKR